MIADRLREKAAESRSAMWGVQTIEADLFDLLADCYEVMLDRPTVSDEFISRTLARIEEVAR